MADVMIDWMHLNKTRSDGSLPYGMILSHFLLKRFVTLDDFDATKTFKPKMGINIHNFSSIHIKMRDGFWFWDNFQVTGPSADFDPYAGSSASNPPKVKALMQYLKAQGNQPDESHDDEIDVDADIGDPPQETARTEPYPKRPGIKKKSIAINLFRRTKHLLSKVVDLFTR